ncbi:hypothetical protein AYI84_13060 [Shewanella algae]|nr:hypothetical protein AYI84_13060 [Shewanella algae]
MQTTSRFGSSVIQISKHPFADNNTALEKSAIFFSGKKINPAQRTDRGLLEKADFDRPRHAFSRMP